MKASRDIKCLSYELQSIVQSKNDLLGNAIVAKKPVDIEVVQESYITYKVLVRGQPSPAKFSVQYRELPAGTVRSDLKVFASTAAKEPREGNCAKQYTNVSVFCEFVANTVHYWIRR